jgi:hypothetical protein
VLRTVEPLKAASGCAVFVLLWLGVSPNLRLASAMAATVFELQSARQPVFRSRGRVLSLVGIYVVLFEINWTALSVSRDLELPDALTLPVATGSLMGQSRLVFAQSDLSA